MMKMKTVGIVLCVLLMAGAAPAAQSLVDVSGTLSYSGYTPQNVYAPGGSSVAAFVDANDITEGVDPDPTSATFDGEVASDADSVTWGVGWSSTGMSVHQTTYTATFDINQLLLDAPEVGDLAAADIQLALELKSSAGALLDSDYRTLADLDQPQTVLTVKTPLSGSNYFGSVVMSVSIDGMAFMATPEVIDPGDDDPGDDDPGDPSVVPVPGAVLLSSLGAGLVGFLRRRRSL